jgi:hypothetical protein
MKHFKKNIGVAGRCLVMAFFHTIHAIIPCKYTSHLYWEFDFKKERHDNQD